jgi:hypothetical protein
LFTERLERKTQVQLIYGQLWNFSAKHKRVFGQNVTRFILSVELLGGVWKLFSGKIQRTAPSKLFCFCASIHRQAMVRLFDDVGYVYCAFA